MLRSHLGEFAALFTVFFWTATALTFESASKKVGSFAVNFIRLFFALILLSVFTFFFRDMAVPTDASSHNWMWLSVSGFIGLVLGDFFLLESFIRIGSRTSMLIMTLVPPMTAFISWMMLGEVLTILNLLGMLLTLAGIALVVLNKTNSDKSVKLKLPLKGLIFAFLGAVGQSVGLVFSKVGMGNYNAFAATQIRVFAGLVGFGIFITLWRKWGDVSKAIFNKKAMFRIAIGSFFGPFLGISFSLFAVQHANTGVASTIMAMVPVLIIPASVIFLKQKATYKEVIGAVISVLGVALFFV